MSETVHSCPDCGQPIRSLLAGKVCPQCLLNLGAAGGSPTTSRGVGMDDLPPIEHLVAAFPNLEIQHLIGVGGMGAVYQAKQINLDRLVALKILSPQLSRDPSFAERFLREARTLAKLTHPNIVTVFDFGQAGDYYFLLMELVDGVNLRDTITANTLSPEVALEIVPQVCEALQYAHDHQVVHRDIKPENILLDKQGRVKIADFGLAKMLDPTPEQFTLTGTRQILGTRNYMAPEQIETPDQVDHRADLYSLGVVFYELLTGELPLGRFSLPSEKSSMLSHKVDDVVLRTLEKDPSRRFQQASQIKTACESLDRDHEYEPANSTPESKMNATTAKREAELEAAEVLVPLAQPFPFELHDIYGSFAAGYGMLRGFTTHLDLEFEIRDAVFGQKWKSSELKIPIEDILWVRLHEGIFQTFVEVQANRFDVVKDLPNGKRGLFRMYVKKRERPMARQLVHGVQTLISSNQASSNAFAAPSAPVKSREDRKKNNPVAIVLVAVFGTIAVALLGLVVLGLMMFGIRKSSTNQKTNQPIVSTVPASTLDSEVKPSIGEATEVLKSKPNEATSAEDH